MEFSRLDRGRRLDVVQCDDARTFPVNRKRRAERRYSSLRTNLEFEHEGLSGEHAEIDGIDAAVHADKLKSQHVSQRSSETPRLQNSASAGCIHIGADDVASFTDRSDSSIVEQHRT